MQAFKDEVYGAGFNADMDASKGVKRKAVAGATQQDNDAAAAEVSPFRSFPFVWSLSFGPFRCRCRG